MTDMTSTERVKTLLGGQLPDRPPLYDVIRNDAVLEHFGEEKLSPETATLSEYSVTKSLL
jgi:hypothetical protein